MCTLDELKAELDEVKKQMDTLTRKGNTAIRKLSSEMGKASSFSHDAKATSEATFVKVGDLEKLLYLWHEEDVSARSASNTRISKIESKQDKQDGALVAAATILAIIINGAAWLVGMSWDYIKGAFN